MFWLKLAGILMPPLLGACLIVGGIFEISDEVASVYGITGFLLGGLVAGIFHELERWFASVSNAYGSASFAKTFDIWRKGFFGKKGLILGKAAGRYLRFNKPGHLLTIAPTRAGKGTCAVIPNLLDYPGSTVTVDIKGENFAIAGRRRKHFGKVFKLAPFDLDSDHFNPMDFVRGGVDAWDDAAFLADMIIIPSGAANGVFFENEAKAFLTGVILYVATQMPPERRNLSEVRRLVTLGGESFYKSVADMSRAKHPLVKRAAHSFGQKDLKLQSSILAEIQSHTLIFDSERLTRVTGTSDFAFEQLKNETVSVFLIVPPEHLSVYRPLIRLFLGLAVSAMTRNPTKPKSDVLFLVDEFPSLGRMKPLEKGLAYLAGYGVMLWLFAQDIGQLESVYDQSATRSMIANTTLQVFGNTDYPTLELISKILGNRTVAVSSKSKGRRSFLLPDYDRFNHSGSETGRPLLTPDEIRCLGPDRQLIFVQGIRPILAWKVAYFKR
tara:strand:+ start:4550 stop:6037 length:1488 start_codon:yes stop_codon:yes gene_type:complete